MLRTSTAFARAPWVTLCLVTATLFCAALTAPGCARTGLGEGFFGEPELSEDAGVPDASESDTVVDVGIDVPMDVTPSVCGDGLVGTDEGCDDGDENSDEAPDACRTDCEPARCGDGVLDSDEQCDALLEPETCSEECRLPAVVCTSCDESAECGRAVDRCSLLTDGRFCTLGCEGGCPDGLGCDSVRTTDGERVEQCLPRLEVCAGCFDRDGDGYGIGLDCVGLDCDDSNAAINPGAIEICDDIDNNCNELNDEVCPPDLIVDAESILLSGQQLYDHVIVRNGGQIVVDPYEGNPTGACTPDGPGCLLITARIIEVLADSSITANGAGDCAGGRGVEAGFGPGLRNTGPAGGGYGGRGGAGPGLLGGATHGVPDGLEVRMGSGGGGFTIEQPGFDGAACDDLVGFASEGGRGGGCISLSAPDIIIEGALFATGRNGEAARDGAAIGIVDGAAGGSGGGIALDGERVRLARSAQIWVAGGQGGSGATYRPVGAGNEPNDQCIGNGGGGGGGGRVKIRATESLSNIAAIDIRGGRGANGPQSDATSGEQGTLFIAP